MECRTTSAFPEAAGDTTLVSLRRAEIRGYIDANLSDPDLNGKAVAAALGISCRYMRLLFACEAETASGYILRRRLEECAAQLSSEEWRELTVSEIAFSWGFNSSAHFARVFRSRFGVSPTEYRRQAQFRDAPIMTQMNAISCS